TGRPRARAGPSRGSTLGPTGFPRGHMPWSSGAGRQAVTEGSCGWLALSAPAKLNLWLHVTGRRPDGYHALQTVFQLLDWGDRIRLRLRDDGQVTRVGG